MSGLLPPEIEAELEEADRRAVERLAWWQDQMDRRPPGGTFVYHYVTGEPTQARGQSKVEG